MADIIIVGGGIIGLSVAWHAARRGASVAVLERGQVGEGASGAAAGMLAPLAEAGKPGAFVELGLASLRAYPQFVHELEAESGLNVECATPGLLRVALDAETAEALARASDWQRGAGMAVERLTGDEARRVEPALSPEVCGAVLSPNEKQYDPRLLVRALAVACARRGVEIRQCAAVQGFLTDGDQVTLVRTADGDLPAGRVVIAGGAWSEQLGGWLGVSLPVFPVKGQIVALSCLPSPFRHTLYAHHSYLVPRADGRIIAGTTAERAGYDARPTAGGMAEVLNAALRIVPSLASAPFESVWAGLRPATEDGLPILGPLPGWQNAWAATGHFRNGILLAPITGALLSAAMLQGDCKGLAPFAATRFN